MRLALAALLLASCGASVSAPVRGVVAVAPSPVVSRAHALRADRSRPLSASHSHFQRLTVTAYTWTGSRTASGLWPREGMAASNLFPLGTKLWIQRVGVVTVTDRVGCCTDVDLYLDSARACVLFGRRELLVEVLP